MTPHTRRIFRASFLASCAVSLLVFIGLCTSASGTAIVVTTGFANGPHSEPGFVDEYNGRSSAGRDTSLNVADIARIDNYHLFFITKHRASPRSLLVSPGPLVNPFRATTSTPSSWSILTARQPLEPAVCGRSSCGAHSRQTVPPRRRFLA